jgi:phosphoribosylglycinamide formyltransferase 2
MGASAVILAHEEGTHPQYAGLEKAMAYPQSDIRIFGKPVTRPYRRMAVALAYDTVGSNVELIKEKAITIAKEITVKATTFNTLPI